MLNKIMNQLVILMTVAAGMIHLVEENYTGFIVNVIFFCVFMYLDHKGY